MSDERLDLLIEQLNAPGKDRRLQALREIKVLIDQGVVAQPTRGVDVNNHIHSIYSFSPYSPSKAVFRSWQSGLTTTGLMDHDSISGAEEFIAAGLILGMPTTIGAEMRVSFAATPLEGLRLNNPDEITVAYIALHGIPHWAIAELAEFFVPICRARGARNRAMIARINTLLAAAGAGLAIDYDADVLPISMAHEGGSVTERHLLFALANKLSARFGRGAALLAFLEQTLGLPITGKNREYLADAGNENYEYDLLNVLKGNLVERFYIPASDEIPPVREVARLAERLGIILAYPYLGDVAESVTGDKKAQHFEDAFLDEVFATVRDEGFKAVTYMPSRNTPAQLDRLRQLCDDYQFFQISGEDINQPRQKFICEAMRQPAFANLYDAAWALIGHELAATGDAGSGFFSPAVVARYPQLAQRIAHFKQYALDAALPHPPQPH